MWDRIERTLDRTNACDIVAVVPDNRDPHLVVNPPNMGFWERVRDWQYKGFVVGLHGYQHISKTSGKSIVPLHSTGEFLSDD